MARLSVNVSEALAAKLNALAHRQGRSRADIVCEAIEQCVREADEAEPFSALELVQDLIPSVGTGPKDLSTNRKYMRGFGE